ncbi:MAG: RNA polymerase sigma factor [Chitinophagaceae bacterium]|nr:RNA polymerase sigma factor [Chitinophagaceae bacterium]
MTELALIEGCIHKKQDYQKELFNLFAGKMMSVCLRYANDEQQAQDILQEAFIKVFSNIQQYRFEGSFEGWLRRVFVTTALRQVSKQKIFFSDTDISDHTEHSVGPEVLSKISADEIHALIRNLPDGYRTIFNLHVIEGYSHEEIAGMLGIQATTSRGQLLKARKHLQVLITKTFNTKKNTENV